MSEANINEIHLSLVRTFQYYKRDISEEKPFGFLVNGEEYYNMVIANEKMLSDKEILVPGLGNLRSAREPPRARPQIIPDGFFFDLPEPHRARMSKTGWLNSLKSLIFREPEMKLVLDYNFPCAIDVIPSKQCNYRVDVSSLPGSMGNVDDAKMSVSLRIYPVGLASLRLGWFFSTNKSFRVEDIIEFLMNKSSIIEIKENTSNKWKRLRVDEFCKEYAWKLINFFHGDKHVQPNWEFTHSIVDIVGSNQLTLENDYKDTFQPLLCLDPQPREDSLKQDLTRRRGEVYLAGPRSLVFYMPSEKFWGRRKIRRFLRNVIELFSIQDYLIGELGKIKKDINYKDLLNKYWLGKLREGILPPMIKDLYSIYYYQTLHFQQVPMEEKEIERYKKILKVMDRKDRIKQSSDDAERLLQDVVTKAEEARKEVGGALKMLLEALIKAKK